MKNIAFLLSFFLLFGLVNAQSTLDKKEMKALQKKYQIYDHGKIFKKAKRIALPGVNLRFKLASKESITDGRHQDQVKYSSWAMLDGIDDADFQEITDDFHKMLVDKFTKFGLEVAPYLEYKDNKGYAKLIEKNTKKRLTVKKTWGAAKVFSAAERPFFVYPMSPLGPHAKFAKTADALIANIHLTIDFAYIGIEAERYGDYAYEYRSATSTIVPVIRIEGMTENQLQVRTDGSYVNIIKDQTDAHALTLASEYSSKLEYATNIESCKGCKPKLGGPGLSDLFSGGSVTGTYKVTADKERFKAAVLDALDKYTDDWFHIYSTHRK